MIAVDLSDLEATAVDVAAASFLQALYVYVDNAGLLGTGSEKRRAADDHRFFLEQGFFDRMRNTWRLSA